MSKLEKILEGKYNYFNKNQVYTEENFKVEREGGLQGNLLFSSEVLSRVKTGEFLKVYIEYRVTPKFDPVDVKITRQLGEKESSENFRIDSREKNVQYVFESNGKKHYHDKILTSLPHIATPCFLTSVIMINQKKLDPVQRTPYTILTSNNIWEFEKGFEEKEVYIELQELEPQQLTIDRIKLKASHCKILAVDENGTIATEGQDIYLSKYYYIPYKAVFSKDLHISIKTLKYYDEKLNSQF